MKFLENIDLNAICRILEWIAIISLVLGIIGSFIIAQEEHGYHTETNVGIVILGIIVTLLDSLFLLFLSRVGDAIDDIRNHQLYSDNVEGDE